MNGRTRARRMGMPMLMLMVGTASSIASSALAAPEGDAPRARPRITIPMPKGAVKDVRVTGYESEGAVGKIVVEGSGMCRLRVATFKAPYDGTRGEPLEAMVFDAPVRLPLTVPMQRPAAAGGGAHVVEITLLGAPSDAGKTAHPGFQGCTLDRPATPGVLRKVFETFAPKPPSAPATPAAVGAAGGIPSLPSGPAPATGKLASILVPDGSFAEDDAQKLQVMGSGGCAFDLAIRRTDAAGAGAAEGKSWPVNPQSLEKGATLYNGTHFETLAEGSYSAKATGKSGCTGSATIDFKVTPRSATSLVKGQPTISLEKQPLSGGVFRRSKDSNILFAVKLPMSVKDEPSAACCEVEYNFKNAFGGWESYASGLFQDPSFGGAMTQTSATAYKSVSGYRDGTEWRVRVRGYKYKTQFEWSDWLEFKVDQN